MVNILNICNCFFFFRKHCLKHLETFRLDKISVSLLNFFLMFHNFSKSHISFNSFCAALRLFFFRRHKTRIQVLLDINYGACFYCCRILCVIIFKILTDRLMLYPNILQTMCFLAFKDEEKWKFKFNHYRFS